MPHRSEPPKPTVTKTQSQSLQGIAENMLEVMEKYPDSIQYVDFDALVKAQEVIAKALTMRPN